MYCASFGTGQRGNPKELKSWGSGNMAKRQPLNLKQKIAVVITALCLAVPINIFAFWLEGAFSPRGVGVIGLANLVVGVGLLAVITEKWIRTWN